MGDSSICVQWICAQGHHSHGCTSVPWWKYCMTWFVHHHICTAVNGQLSCKRLTISLIHLHNCRGSYSIPHPWQNGRLKTSPPDRHKHPLQCFPSTDETQNHDYPTCINTAAESGPGVGQLE